MATTIENYLTDGIVSFAFPKLTPIPMSEVR